MAISKLFIISIILVALTFSSTLTPASATSRNLQAFPTFHFPFFGGSPSGDSSSPPSSGFSFFPPFPFFSSPANGVPGGYMPPATAATTTHTP
ncbi:hypothetical protein DCAR_0624297 [Daucus carota subsp. sativus]|uniref:Uncharacterized protein n=1 Tax=Daucus carota subsp. sativus TaxID=79200 RepID=A0A164VRG8_DAUCS|nr:hypothetical protein DCAR_0624297 [Daucus carota subsp. sativus]